MELANLDRQLSEARATAEALELSDEVWGQLASTIHQEIASLSDGAVTQLALLMLVPPSRYLEEMTAFQAWMDFAFEQHANPVVVRAQVMTQLYVSFVWLRDSVMRPIAQALPETSTFAAVEKYLGSGRRRSLRNAVPMADGATSPTLEVWNVGPSHDGASCTSGSRSVNANLRHGNCSAAEPQSLLSSPWPMRRRGPRPDDEVDAWPPTSPACTFGTPEPMAA